MSDVTELERLIDLFAASIRRVECGDDPHEVCMTRRELVAFVCNRLPSSSSDSSEPNWRKSWYCGRCDRDTPTNEDGKCPVCTKYKVLPPDLEPHREGSS